MPHTPTPYQFPDGLKPLTTALYCLEAWSRGCDFDDYWRDVEEAMQGLRGMLPDSSQQPTVTGETK